MINAEARGGNAPGILKSRRIKRENQIGQTIAQIGKSALDIASVVRAGNVLYDTATARFDNRKILTGCQ